MIAEKERAKIAARMMNKLRARIDPMIELWIDDPDVYEANAAHPESERAAVVPWTVAAVVIQFLGV